MQQMIKEHCFALKLGSRIYENYINIKATTNEEFLEKLLKSEVQAREINRKRE